MNVNPSLLQADTSSLALDVLHSAQLCQKENILSKKAYLSLREFSTSKNSMCSYKGPNFKDNVLYSSTEPCVRDRYI